MSEFDRAKSQLREACGLFGDWLTSDDEDFVRRRLTSDAPETTAAPLAPKGACELCGGNPVIQFDAVTQTAVRVDCPKCRPAPTAR